MSALEGTFHSSRGLKLWLETAAYMEDFCIKHEVGSAGNFTRICGSPRIVQKPRTHRDHMINFVL